MIKRFYLKLPTALIALFLSIVFFNDPGYCRYYKWIDDNGQIHITDYPPPEKETSPEPDNEQTAGQPGVQPSPSVSTPAKAPSGVQADKETAKPVSTPPATPKAAQPVPTSIPPVAAPVTPPPHPAPATPPAATAKKPQQSPVASTKPPLQPAADSAPATTTAVSPPPVAKPHPAPVAPQRTMPPVAKTKPATPLEGMYDVETLKNKLVGFLVYLLAFLALAALISIAFLFVLYKTAKKLNVSSAWMAWVPLLNLFIMAQMAGRPVWWGVLLMLPVVGSVVFVILWMDICQRLGLKKQLGLLMLIPIVVPIVLSYLAPTVVIGTSQMFIIPFAVLFFLSFSAVFLLPLYYLRQAGRITPQDNIDYGYDPYDQSTKPEDSLPQEEELPVFLKKTPADSTLPEDDTQDRDVYTYDETADIADVVSDKNRSIVSDIDQVPASEISFGREYIMDSSEDQYLQPANEVEDRGIELRQKLTEEDRFDDTGDSFAHSEDSTVVRNAMELRKKTEVEFEPVFEIGAEDEFGVENGDLVIAEGDLGIDGGEQEYLLSDKDEVLAGEIEFGIEIPQESTSEDSTWVLGKDGSSKIGTDEFTPESPKDEVLAGEIEFGVEMPQESTSEDATWVLDKDGSSKIGKETFKPEPPKDETLAGEIEFGIEDEQWEDPTLVLNTGNMGIINRVLDEKPAVDINMEGDFGIETSELRIDLGIDSAQGDADDRNLEIDGLDDEKSPDVSEDIASEYDSGAIEADQEQTIDLGDKVEIDFELQEDMGAIEDITLDYSGVDLSAPDEAGLEIEPSMELDIAEEELHGAEELSGELDLGPEIREEEDAGPARDDLSGDIEGLQTDMGLDTGGGELEFDAESEPIPYEGGLEIDGLEIDDLEAEEASLDSIELELDESEAPTYMSDIDHLQPEAVADESGLEIDGLEAEEASLDSIELELDESEAPTYMSDIDHLQPEMVTEGGSEPDDDFETPTLLTDSEIQFDDGQAAVEYDGIDLPDDDGIDYADGLQIDIGDDDLDVELKYDAGLTIEDQDAIKTAIIGKKSHPLRTADNIDVKPQSDHDLDALSLEDDNKDGEVYDLSDDEGFDIADDDDFSFSSIESLPENLGEFKHMPPEASGLAPEINDSLEKTIGLDMSMSDKNKAPLMDKNPRAADDDDDDTIKIKNSKER
ncbi:MAG: DUF4124 domain-containing protein [Magnetococcales bacterium]|nr:DUF4124 domain-containing protein [Nitrospirota bacterium]